MKRTLRWALRGFIAFSVLMLVVLLCRNPLLRAFTEYRIHDATGLRAEIGELRTSLSFSTTTVRDFKILNLPEFGPSSLLVAPEIYLELDPQPTASGRIRFKEARVHLAEFNAVRGRDGRLNLEAAGHAIRERLRRRRRMRLIDADFAGIDRLYVTLGRLNFVDLSQPERNRTFDLGITNELVTTIQSEDDFYAWATALAMRLAMREYLSQPDKAGETTLKLLLDALRPKE